ncbi:MAG: 50S ribosomal protein L35 [Candidatus Paceibacterota bacterium]
MAKHSTTKSVTKRIKITRNGKIVRRPMGVNHFKTKRTANQLRNKRSSRSLDYPIKKILNY